MDPDELPAAAAAALTRARRWAAVLGATTVALAISLGVVATRDAPDVGVPSDAERALLDDDVRAAAIAELVSRGSGVWDSHPDPDVGRVLQPGIRDRELMDVPVSSNRFGMREKEYGAKPTGTVRVVLLGDSFVLGHGTRLDERIGHFLEPWLEERSASDADVEVLHLGASSWNIVAEAAYLRRQLSFLRPDLVVQIVFNNDLDDVKGVRGFGDRARFAPRHRERATGLVSRDAPRLAAGVNTSNLLLYGVDGESRARYEEAASALAEVAGAVRAAGGEYLCLAMWLYFQPLAPQLLAQLDADERGYVSDAFLSDRSTWAGPRNNHWNAEGSSRIAKLIYALARERGLLPSLELADWPEATAEVAAIDGAARAEAGDVDAMQQRFAIHQVSSSLRFDELTARSASWINGGFDGQGLAAPYASLTLARDGGSELLLRGERLPRPELRDASVRVFVDDELAGELPLRGDTEFSLAFPLPGDSTRRDFVAVRFVAPDFVYEGELLDRCVAFRLVEATIR